MSTKRGPTQAAKRTHKKAHGDPNDIGIRQHHLEEWCINAAGHGDDDAACRPILGGIKSACIKLRCELSEDDRADRHCDAVAKLWKQSPRFLEYLARHSICSVKVAKAKFDYLAFITAHRLTQQFILKRFRHARIDKCIYQSLAQSYSLPKVNFPLLDAINHFARLLRAHNKRNYFLLRTFMRNFEEFPSFPNRNDYATLLRIAFNEKAILRNIKPFQTDKAVRVAFSRVRVKLAAFLKKRGWSIPLEKDANHESHSIQVKETEKAQTSSPTPRDAAGS